MQFGLNASAGIKRVAAPSKATLSMINVISCATGLYTAKDILLNCLLGKGMLFS